MIKAAYVTENANAIANDGPLITKGRAYFDMVLEHTKQHLNQSAVRLSAWVCTPA